MEKVEGGKEAVFWHKGKFQKMSNTLNSNVLKQMFTLNHTSTNNYWEWNVMAHAYYNVYDFKKYTL